MHRAYQPYTPVNNVFLKQRWDKDVYRIHRTKVKAGKKKQTFFFFCFNHFKLFVESFCYLKISGIGEEDNFTL